MAIMQAAGNTKMHNRLIRPGMLLIPAAVALGVLMRFAPGLASPTPQEVFSAWKSGQHGTKSGLVLPAMENVNHAQLAQREIMKLKPMVETQGVIARGREAKPLRPGQSAIARNRNEEPSPPLPFDSLVTSMQDYLVYFQPDVVIPILHNGSYVYIHAERFADDANSAIRYSTVVMQRDSTSPSEQLTLQECIQVLGNVGGILVIPNRNMSYADTSFANEVRRVGTLISWHVPDNAGEPPQVPINPNLTLSSYPNPFNNSTTFKFELAQEAAVKLTVHDLLGRTVAKIVDGRMAPGEHEVPWDAREFATGTYIAVLNLGGQRAVWRIKLVK
jgi:hypothetical protein